MTKNNQLHIQVLSDLEEISHKAAELFTAISRSCIEARGRFVAAISGGSTPVRLYALLGSDQYRNRVDWSRIHFFWVDERCVPAYDQDSNFRMAYENLLSTVPVSPEHIHRIKGEEGPEKGARAYEEEIRNFFGITGNEIAPVFDLIILGIGNDGHTASLFPGSKALDERKDMAVPVVMKGPKKDRVTLSFPVLNNAQNIIFLVSGNSKAGIVQTVLEDKDKRCLYPAGIINPVHGNITWLIDKAAAHLLKTIE